MYIYFILNLQLLGFIFWIRYLTLHGKVQSWLKLTFLRCLRCRKYDACDVLSPLADLGRFLNTQPIFDWHRSHQICRYCTVYKWSILCHMPNLCSVDIYKRIGTHVHHQWPQYQHIGCQRCQSHKTCLNSAKGERRKADRSLGWRRCRLCIKSFFSIWSSRRF